MASGRMYCHQGHEFTGVDSRGHALCLVCKRAASARYRARRNETSPVRPVRHGLTIDQFETLPPEKRLCLNGHLLTAENIRMPKFKSRIVICKTCRRTSSKLRVTEGRMRPQSIRRAIALIEEGATKANLAGFVGGKKVLPHTIEMVTFNNWLRKNPKMAKRLEPKLEANRKRRFAEGMQGRRKNLAPAATMNALEKIEAALTMWLDPVTERPDIISAMWLAIGDGKLKSADIKARAKEFVKAHRRGYTNTGRYALNSLDAPVGDDNPTSRIERLTAQDALWSPA